MSRADKSFVERCLAGEALADEIDDYIDLWHSGDGEPIESLAQFLGFTDLEYRLWVEKPHFLEFILNSKRRNIPLEKCELSEGSYSIAARGFSAEDAEELNEWFKKSGELPR